MSFAGVNGKSGQNGAQGGKPWASARAYAEAIQAPMVCFRDPALRVCEPAFDRLGMPLVTSGQFAYVFKLRPPMPSSAPLAVRCFRADASDRAERYRCISSHLARHTVPAVGAFRYDPEGILVQGRRLPTLVMEWVEGHTLDVYLEETINNSSVLRHLADEWLRLLTSLREAGVAHGDLQHGNIIVRRGSLRLIDLDGMFVPALAGWTAGEIGHQHYQHPRRDETLFDRKLDRFSALVIYTTFVALAEAPALWAEHHDENLIFTKDDFLDPASSRLFAQIKEIGGEASRLADELERAALGAPEDVPDVLDLVVPRSKLPSWMRDSTNDDKASDVWVAVEGRTREASRVDVPAGVLVKDFTSDATHAHAPGALRYAGASVPSTPASTGVQSVFSGAAPVAGQAVMPAPFAAPLDPADLLPATMYFAKTAARQGVAYVWVLFWFATGGLKLLGIPAPMSWLIAALAYLVPCIIYGFLRAHGNLDPAGAASLQLSNALRGSITGAHAPRRTTLAFGAGTTGALAAHHTGTGQIVVGSRTQSIYHRETCDWARRINVRNRVAFASDAEARAAGYQGCKVCQP